jgi:tripartite-type tricarboxylate transporter receptor subunit TctC
MLFMSAINTELTTVQYKGTAPAMQDLLGGQVDLPCDQTTQTTSPIKAERIKVYGVTSKTRLDTLPNVPTLAEQGLTGFEVVVWHGLYAPKGTPKPVLDKLNAALLAALKDPAVLAKFADLSAVPVTPDQATPDALRAHLRKEIDKYGPEIRKAGVFAD